MPVQDLWKAPDQRKGESAALSELVERWVSRILLVAMTLGATALFIDGLYDALSLSNGANVLHYAFLGLAGLAFCWMAFGAANALLGTMAILRGYRHDTVQLVTATSLDADAANATALLFPIYHENSKEIARTIQSLGVQLKASGASNRYHFFVLSDSQNEDFRNREKLVFTRLMRDLGPEVAIFYRNRRANTEKKAGNVADWLRNFGGAYPYFVVFDADSEMTAETLGSLAATMDADPGLGLIQTVPRLRDSQTVFGQLQCFANVNYGEPAAAGYASWQGDSGNYWGHNAIIRTTAFGECAGLPVIEGPAPFGGHIRSHDFVEAALMRRCGWKIALVTALSGSDEASPPTLCDMAVRDRRWMQGNLQHIAVLPAKGLTPVSRIHLSLGVFSYVSSAVWLGMLLVGLWLAIHERGQEISYFTERSLFPNWPKFDPEAGLIVLLGTLVVVLLPKILGLIVALRKMFNAGLATMRTAVQLVSGFFYELILSALIAPVFMLLHLQFLAEIVSGKDSGWNAQNRQSRGLRFVEAIRFHLLHVAAGLVLAGVAMSTSQSVVLWLSPVIAGLVLSPILTWYTSRPKSVFEGKLLEPLRAKSTHGS